MKWLGWTTSRWWNCLKSRGISLRNSRQCRIKNNRQRNFEFKCSGMQAIRRLKATGTFHELFGWNEVLLFWFTNYLYSRKCEKNAKQNGLMYFEFWKHFSLFTFWKNFVNKKNATRIQNILTHSVWHFSYICDYKGSWWTKTTKPHFSQKVRETYQLPSAF